MEQPFTITEIDKIPEGAVRIHLYNSKNVLMPRGSMKKESIGLYLYEKLMDLYEDWTDPKYGDNPEEEELLDTLRKNLDHEVECAWQALLSEINHADH
jgi:hypothetical protein